LILAEQKSDKSVENSQVICAYLVHLKPALFPSSVLVKQVNGGLMGNTFESFVKNSFRTCNSSPHAGSELTMLLVNNLPPCSLRTMYIPVGD
jgi:hypothetical protein